MKKPLALLAAVLFVAGCSDQARRHPEHEDCWVISDQNDKFKAIACEVDIETER